MRVPTEIAVSWLTLAYGEDKAAETVIEKRPPGMRFANSAEVHGGRR